MKAPSLQTALAIAGALALVAIACGEGTYSYLGRRYSPERDCLFTTVSLDVMKGEDPGNCETKCLSVAPGDGGPVREAYVTVMCGETPRGAVPATDGACAFALAASGRKDTCLSDGGSSHPSPKDAAAE